MATNIANYTHSVVLKIGIPQFSGLHLPNSHSEFIMLKRKITLKIVIIYTEIRGFFFQKLKTSVKLGLFGALKLATLILVLQILLMQSDYRHFHPHLNLNLNRNSAK